MTGPIVWSSITASAIGASHKRQENPINQDAIAYGPQDGAVSRGRWIAAADGHGSPVHFRSHTGARFAVESVLEEPADPEPAGLASRIVARWREWVRKDLEVNPLTEVEQRTANSGSPVLAYGCTCLAVAAMDRIGVCLQLGDGDVVWFDAEGKATRFVPPADLPGEQTHSLCQPDAAAYMKVSVYEWNPLPELVLIATDGLVKSFASDEGFFQFGSDLATRLRQPGGAVEVEARMPLWLEHISEQGSGDDISVGLLFPAPGGSR